MLQNPALPFTSLREKFTKSHPCGMDDKDVPSFYSELIKEFKFKTLTNENKIAFIVVAHFVHSLPYFLEALSSMGKIAAIISKQSRTVESVRDTIIKIYKDVFFGKINKENLSNDQVKATDFFTALLNDEEWKDFRFVILDHGGYFAPRIHDVLSLSMFKEKIIGVVEHTWNGEIRYKKQIEEKATACFPFPILSIAHSSLKGLESEAVAHSIVDALSVKLAGEGIGQSIDRLQCILILGYGNIGKGVALVLKRRFSHLNNNIVHICDISKEMVEDARAYFPEENLATNKDKFLQKADLIITATSTQVLTKEDFSNLKSGAIIACATSSDDQFTEGSLSDYRRCIGESTVERPKISCIKYQHTLKEQDIFLVENGDSVNFSIGSTANPIIHLILGSIFVNVKRLIEFNNFELNQIHFSVEEEEANLKKVYESIFGVIITPSEEFKQQFKLLQGLVQYNKVRELSSSEREKLGRIALEVAHRMHNDDQWQVLYELTQGNIIKRNTRATLVLRLAEYPIHTTIRWQKLFNLARDTNIKRNVRTKLAICLANCPILTPKRWEQLFTLANDTMIERDAHKIIVLRLIKCPEFSLEQSQNLSKLIEEGSVGTHEYIKQFINPPSKNNGSINNCNIIHPVPDSLVEEASVELKKSVSEFVDCKQKTKCFSFIVKRNETEQEIYIQLINKNSIRLQEKMIRENLITLSNILEEGLKNQHLFDGEHYDFDKFDAEIGSITIISKDIATLNCIGTILKDAGQNYWNQAQLTNSNVFFFKPEKRVQATHQLQNRDKEEQQKSDEITCGIQ